MICVGLCKKKNAVVIIITRLLLLYFTEPTLTASITVENEEESDVAISIEMWDNKQQSPEIQLQSSGQNILSQFWIYDLKVARCERGYYCPFNSTNQMIPCPAGTYGPQEGATDISDCLPCPLGTFSAISGRGTICPPCPADNVCENSTSIYACPNFTVSPEATYSVRDCECLENYDCTYQKKISVSLTLDTTANLEQILAVDSDNTSSAELLIIQQQLVWALASANNIDPSRVIFKGFRKIIT